jgi:phosphoenolpyruvate carboxylase
VRHRIGSLELDVIFWLIRSFTAFFHLVTLDIRQHSRVHAEAVPDLLTLAGVTDAYENLAEPDKEAFLAHRPATRSTIHLRNAYTDVLNLIQVELMKR